MHSFIKTIALSSIVAFAAISLPAVAEEKLLSAAEVQKIIVGNTVTAEINGKSFKAFFDAKGKYTRIQDGKTSEGSYNVTADGTHCVKFESTETCAKIRDNGNSTYTRIENGQAKATWTKVVAGKNL